MMPTTSAASIPSRRVMTSDSNTPRPPGRPPGRRARAPRRLRGARPAAAADLVHVPGHQESLAPADLVLEPLDLAALELDDPAAGEADHVIVVVTAHHHLVARLPLGHLDLVHQPLLDQPRQGAVERGAGHPPPLAVEV